jgi:hypothetical protein
MTGGRQERNRRAGTENVPALVGLGVAAARARTRLAEIGRVAALRDTLERDLLAAVPGTHVNGRPDARVANTSNIGFEGIEAESLVIAFDLEGIAVSTGSACSSGTLEPSHVLKAMGLDPHDTQNAIRFSLGFSTTAEDVARVVALAPALVERLRASRRRHQPRPRRGAGLARRLTMRVVVAMSGGVDSAVAAALMADQGHDVVGVSMQLYDQRPREDGSPRLRIVLLPRRPARRPPRRRRARRAALRDELRAAVRRARGRSLRRRVHAGPHPDPVHALQQRSQVLDAAGTRRRPRGRRPRHRALRARRLRRGPPPVRAAPGRRSPPRSVVLPVRADAGAAGAGPLPGRRPGEGGGAGVRAHPQPAGGREAREPRHLLRARRRLRGFIERRDAGAREAEGVFVDAAAASWDATRASIGSPSGQRKGLGLSAPAPLYVLALDAEGQRVTVGPKAALERTALEAGEVSWIAGAPPTAPRRALAQIRYQHAAAAGQLTPLPTAGARFDFDAPQPAVAPGQAAVFYDGDEVIGGGWIA